MADVRDARVCVCVRACLCGGGGGLGGSDAAGASCVCEGQGSYMIGAFPCGSRFSIHAYVSERLHSTR